MFSEINCFLRKVFLVIGALAALTVLIDKANKKEETGEVQAHEFDDIW